MKVSTDACIQGAWTPLMTEVTQVLDIGGGTGLLSLMMAQRLPHAQILSVEIEAAAATEAAQNFSASPWPQRLSVINEDIRTLQPAKSFDLIICNPPFFSNSLLGETESRNKARHSLSLSFEDLFKALEKHLSHNGYASIMLPTTEHMRWAALLKAQNWYVTQELHVVPRVNQQPNRIVSLCSRQYRPLQVEELIIKASADHYTPEFTQLLQPFYLKL